jgi:hypothetical protein
MAEDDEVLTREQVVALIGKYAQRLADLARDHGFGKLHVRLYLAAKQADKDLEALTARGENVKNE